MIGVSDHAILRHLERAAGQDIAALRVAVGEAIARSAAAAAQLGVTSYNVHTGGVFYLIRESVVVTILPEDTSIGTRSRSLRRGARELPPA